jgi:hypothetical protein
MAHFSNFIEIPPQKIHTADGSMLSVIGQGDIQIDLLLGQGRTSITLKNALYAPKMVFILISTNCIMAAGLAVHFKGRMCQILSQGPRCHIIAEIPQVEGLYSIISSHSRHYVNVATQKLTISTLHRVLGHISQMVVVEAVKKGLVTGVTLDKSSKPEFCEACIKAKSAQRPFPDESKMRALTYGELVHTDLWGPAQTTSLGGCLYYISFTDDYSY